VGQWVMGAGYKVPYAIDGVQPLRMRTCVHHSLIIHKLPYVTHVCVLILLIFFNFLRLLRCLAMASSANFFNFFKFFASATLPCHGE
jgi:hypothetical protein